MTQEAVADEVKRLFRRMLKTLKVEGSETIFYRERLIAMQSSECAAGNGEMGKIKRLAECLSQQ